MLKSERKKRGLFVSTNYGSSYIFYLSESRQLWVEDVVAPILLMANYLASERLRNLTKVTERISKAAGFCT